VESLHNVTTADGCSFRLQKGHFSEDVCRLSTEDYSSLAEDRLETAAWQIRRFEQLYATILKMNDGLPEVSWIFLEHITVWLSSIERHLVPFPLNNLTLFRLSLYEHYLCYHYKTTIIYYNIMLFVNGDSFSRTFTSVFSFCFFLFFFLNFFFANCSNNLSSSQRHRVLN